MEGKITAARITELPKTFSDPIPKVFVKFSNNTEETEEVELFDYFPDEISFTTDEFIGLTRGQALELKECKDRAYLQS